jgi:tetratricopeptide (TPR) repeat protein
MQFAISDDAAITFARGFYSALAAGRPVDAAVTQARLAIFAAGNDVEWGTPVLYMRSPDGSIFDVEALNPDELVAEAARADAKTRAKRESEGAEAARQLAAVQAEEGKGREEARQAELARLYAVGDAAVQAREWSKAIESFEAALRLDARYRDAAARLTQARDALAEEQAARERLSIQLPKLYQEALAHLQAQHWQEAIVDLRVVLAIDPHYGDPTHGSAAALLARAQQQLELAKSPPPPAAGPPRPTTLPEDIKPSGKPRDLPR